MIHVQEHDNWLDDYDNAAMWWHQLDEDKRREDMVDRTNAFEGEGGQWLKAEDLKGGAVKVTIESVSEQEFEDFNTKKPVKKICLKFAGKEKGLVLNKTNGEKLILQYGGDDDGWVGKEVGLEYHYYDDFGKAGIVLSILDKEFNDSIPF